MQTIKLNNGIEMPVLGYGVFQVSPEECERCVLDAISTGYRLIDTAQAYYNEEGVGNAVTRCGVPRNELFLTTKIWISNAGETNAARSIDESLRKLHTDYIDLLLIHQPFSDYPGTWRAMEKAVKDGKVRAIGLSNFNEAQIREILSLCEVKPTVLQTEVHPYSQEKALKKYLDGEGIVIQAWYPLGHGDKTLIQEPLFAELGKKYGKTSAQIILRWHIQDGNIVIPGSKNPAHIRDNFDLFDFSLSDAEMAEIAKLDKQKRYYVSTPEMLKAYVNMVPDVDGQK